VSDLQHPGSRSFELVAGLYERTRPEYPKEAIAWMSAELALGSGTTVLDLGAGTGKLTRALVANGARLIAVEPGEAMLAQLRRALPGVEALLGAAEDVPLPDASVDAVTIGQAFHWFRQDEALPEIHRVLRPGGGVGLIWNERETESPLQRAVSELIAPFVPTGRPGREDWPKPLAESGLFGPLASRSFRFSQELDEDQLVDRIASISFVAAATPAEQDELGAALRQLVPAGGTVKFDYVTSVYVARARQERGVSATSSPPSSS
jgi:SAM-dependent methyltransferase